MNEAKSIANRILEASLYGFLLVAALNVIAYFALVSEVIAKEDVTRSYAQVASMIVNSVFSLLVYLLALLFALVRGAIKPIGPYTVKSGLRSSGKAPLARRWRTDLLICFD